MWELLRLHLRFFPTTSVFASATDTTTASHHTFKLPCSDSMWHFYPFKATFTINYNEAKMIPYFMDSRFGEEKNREKNCLHSSLWDRKPKQRLSQATALMVNAANRCMRIFVVWGAVNAGKVLFFCCCCCFWYTYVNKPQPSVSKFKYNLNIHNDSYNLIIWLVFGRQSSNPNQSNDLSLHVTVCDGDTAV